MPDTLAYLLHLVREHFSRPAIRSSEFLPLQQIMQADIVEDTAPPFKLYGQSRWLARGPLIRNIAKNWDTLGTYFAAIKKIVPMEQRMDVASLVEILQDRSVYVLLTFLLPIVEQCETLNAMFEGTAGAEAANTALLRWHASLQKRVSVGAGPRAAADKLPRKDVDFGVIFERECARWKGVVGAEKIEEVRSCAWAFLIRLVDEVAKRLPAHMAAFQQLAFFSPATVLSSSTPTRFGQMPFIQCVMDRAELWEIEEQWRQACVEDWATAKPFRHLPRVPSDPVDFWSGVRVFKSGGDNGDNVDFGAAADGASEDQIFYKLATFVLGRLTMAHSTAAVERTFSSVSCVNTHLRASSTLEAILRCRTYLFNRGRCCQSLAPTDHMLELFSQMEGDTLEEEELENCIQIGHFLP